MKWTRGSSLACALVAVALLGQALLAQEGIRRGTIKRVDPDRGVVTITTEGEDRDFAVTERTQIKDVPGRAVADGLKNPAFRQGAPVMFKAATRDGKAVLAGLKLAGPDGRQARQGPPPKVDMSGVKALSDMAPGDRYQGVEGGLYPGGSARRPSGHEEAGLELARQIKPLDREGRPDPAGKVVLLSVGMSNTNQASGGFLRALKGDDAIHPSLVFVNGAQGGMTASMIQNPDDGGRGAQYWATVDERLKEAGVTRAQVQAAWIKQADAAPTQGFPRYAQTLQAELARIAQVLHDRFPNLKLAYVSNRTYGGWAKTRLNPEPYAYEAGFAVKWLIAQQIDGDPALNFDPRRGPVKAPWLSWGPDLWANGSTPRHDGFRFEEADFTDADGTHESRQGQDKVGRLLLEFFKTDPTTRAWFLRGGTGAG